MLHWVSLGCVSHGPTATTSSPFTSLLLREPSPNPAPLKRATRRPTHSSTPDSLSQIFLLITFLILKYLIYLLLLWVMVCLPLLEYQLSKDLSLDHSWPDICLPQLWAYDALRPLGTALSPEQGQEDEEAGWYLCREARPG